MELWNELVNWFMNDGSLDMLVSILTPVVVAIGMWLIKRTNAEKIIANFQKKNADNKYIDLVDKVVGKLENNEKENQNIEADLKVLTQMLICVIKNSRISGDDKEKCILMANKLNAITETIKVEISNKDENKIEVLEEETENPYLKAFEDDLQ